MKQPNRSELSMLSLQCYSHESSAEAKWCHGHGNMSKYWNQWSHSVKNRIPNGITAMNLFFPATGTYWFLHNKNWNQLKDRKKE